MLVKGNNILIKFEENSNVIDVTVLKPLTSRRRSCVSILILSRYFLVDEILFF